MRPERYPDGHDPTVASAGARRPDRRPPRVPALLRDRRAPLSRLLFRLPIALYRVGLGWLLGHQFLLLTHTGRCTGRVRHTALKVLRYDPATGESVVASAWGPTADWYRNLRARPAVAVRTAHDRFVPEQRLLPRAEAFAVFDDWARRQRWFARLMLSQLGLPGRSRRRSVGPSSPGSRSWGSALAPTVALLPPRRVSAASGTAAGASGARPAAGAHASHPPATYQLIEGVQPGSGGRTQPRMSGLLTVCVRPGGAVGAVQPSAGRMVGGSGRPLARLLGRETTETTAAEQRAGATCQGESFATGARRRAAARP